MLGKERASARRVSIGIHLHVNRVSEYTRREAHRLGFGCTEGTNTQTATPDRIRTGAVSAVLLVLVLALGDLDLDAGLGDELGHHDVSGPPGQLLP